MEKISMLLGLCEGKPPVTGGFPSQRPVTWSFDVFFAIALIMMSLQCSFRDILYGIEILGHIVSAKLVQISTAIYEIISHCEISWWNWLKESLGYLFLSFKPCTTGLYSTEVMHICID